MLYSITNWSGNVHHMSAKDIYLRVMQDSKSDYNWIASATELVRICKIPSFPAYYARKIKIAILNCFANLELKKHVASYGLSTDKKAVYYCYNSLSNTDTTSFEVKSKYLKAIITGVTIYHFDVVTKLTLPSGLTYKNICNKWINRKFNHFILEQNIDFDKLINELHNSFDETINKAKEHGAFDKDYEEERMERRKIAKMIMNIDI